MLLLLRLWCISVHQSISACMFVYPIVYISETTVGLHGLGETNRRLSLQLSAIEHFRWLVAASGTVCRLTLPQLQPWLFFGIASKLSFSPDHFLTNRFPFLVLHAVYCSGLAVLYLGHSK